MRLIGRPSTPLTPSSATSSGISWARRRNLSTSLCAPSVLPVSIGRFAMDLGDLARARAAHSYSRQLIADTSDHANRSIASANLAEVELDVGRFRQTLDYSEAALALATEAK